MAEAAVTTIRIRNSDGTYGDPMPIGANSNNITVLGTVGGNDPTLSNVLGTVLLTEGNLQEQILKLKAEIETLKSYHEESTSE